MRISDWSSDVCSSDLPSTRLHRNLNPRIAAIALTLAPQTPLDSVPLPLRTRYKQYPQRVGQLRLSALEYWEPAVHNAEDSVRFAAGVAVRCAGERLHRRRVPGSGQIGRAHV